MQDCMRVCSEAAESIIEFVSHGIQVSEDKTEGFRKEERGGWLGATREDEAWKGLDVGC